MINKEMHEWIVKRKQVNDKPDRLDIILTSLTFFFVFNIALKVLPLGPFFLISLLSDNIFCIWILIGISTLTSLVATYKLAQEEIERHQ